MYVAIDYLKRLFPTLKLNCLGIVSKNKIDVDRWEVYIIKYLHIFYYIFTK